jgi:hypothetical protein
MNRFCPRVVNATKILFLLLLFTAIGFSPGGSSPYTSKKKKKKKKLSLLNKGLKYNLQVKNWIKNMVLEADMPINNFPFQKQEVVRYSVARNIEKQFCIKTNSVL